MGILIGIYVADTAGSVVRSLPEAELVVGRGIVGDRYYAGSGKFSPAVQEPDHEVTLLEIEQLTEFNSTHGLALGPEEVRRNLVTRGIDLNALVGLEFTVGEVVLRGIRLCEPCEYLVGLTDRAVLTGLLHRAGLRAAIVKGGVVAVGDTAARRQVA